MSHKLLYWIISLILLIVAVFAYNIPAEGAPLHNEAEIAAASTLLAMVTPQSTETALPVSTVVLPSNTPTSQPTIAASPTLTYSVPMLTLRDATNCRTGPGVSYEIVVTYPIGQSLEILGRYEPGNFWLVKSSESPNGSCWLWGEYADVSGSTWATAAVTPPSTPIASVTPRPSAPQAPSMQDYDYYCDDVDHTFSFQVLWEDRSGNEFGYRILREGSVVAELPAGSTYYFETIPMPESRGAQYSIQAYNEYGSATDLVETVVCEL